MTGQLCKLVVISSFSLRLASEQINISPRKYFSLYLSSFRCSPRVVNGCGGKRGQKMPLENVYCDPVTQRRSRQPLSRVASAFSPRFCDTFQECVDCYRCCAVVLDPSFPTLYRLGGMLTLAGEKILVNYSRDLYFPLLLDRTILFRGI